MDERVSQLISLAKKEVDPFKKAQIYQKLRKQFNLRLSEVAKIFSLKPSYLCHYLRLNRLPEIIVDGYYNRDISLSHLFIISRLKTSERILAVYEQVLAKNLTVQQTEDLVREILYGVNAEGERISDQEKKRYKQELSTLYSNIQLKIIQTRGRGKLVIGFDGSFKKTSQLIKQILDKLTISK